MFIDRNRVFCPKKKLSNLNMQEAKQQNNFLLEAEGNLTQLLINLIFI